MRNTLVMNIIVFCFMTGGLYAQSNLVPNGGFENGNTDNWGLDAGGGSSVTYSLDSTSATEGNYCLKAEIATLGTSPWSVQIKNAFGPVVEGHLYRASIWAKTAPAGSTVNYTIGKATAGYDEYASSYGLGLTSEWTEYVHEFTASVSTTNDITLAMHITGLATYWFDNFKVVEVVDEINSATIATTGLRVVLDFNTNIAVPEETEYLPFFVYSADNSYTIDEITAHTSSDKLNLYLAEPVPKDESIIVEYIPGNLRNTAGIELEAFSIEALNNSTYVPALAINGKSLQEQIKVYPTVFTSQLNIEFPVEGLVNSLRITDLSGKIIGDYQVGSGLQTELDLGHLSAGMYLMFFVKDKINLGVVKIIKY